MSEFRVYNVPVKQVFETQFSICARNEAEAKALATKKFEFFWNIQNDSSNDIRLAEINIGDAVESGVDEMSEFVYDIPSNDVIPADEYR